jgi:hypothetical protein
MALLGEFVFPDESVKVEIQIHDTEHSGLLPSACPMSHGIFKVIPC